MQNSVINKSEIIDSILTLLLCTLAFPLLVLYIATIGPLLSLYKLIFRSTKEDAPKSKKIKYQKSILKDTKMSFKEKMCSVDALIVLVVVFVITYSINSFQ